MEAGKTRGLAPGEDIDFHVELSGSSCLGWPHSVGLAKHHTMEQPESLWEISGLSPFSTF